MSQRQLFLLVLGTLVLSVSFLPHNSVGALDEPFIRYVGVFSDGDVNITDHETLTMQNCESSLTGRLIAEQDAEIAVRNANLTLSPLSGDGISLVLKGRARLSVVNSTIIFNRTVGDCQIILQDEAQANITNSVLTGWGYLIGRHASSVYVNNSQIRNAILGTHSPGVVTYGSSSMVVVQSTVDGIYVWENSTASVNRSDVGVIRTTWTESDNTAINVTDTHVGSIETNGGNAVFHVRNSTVEYTAYFHVNTQAWLEDSSVSSIRATGNATIYLVNSSVGEVSTEDNAEVLVGWYWPIVGLVTVPYHWVQYLEAASIVGIFIGLGAVFYAVYMRKRAKEEG